MSETKLNNKRSRCDSDLYIDNDDYDDWNKCNKSDMYNLLEDGIYTDGTDIHFTASINDKTIIIITKYITDIIKKNISKYKHNDKKLNITYIVDSPGGSVSAILKFVDYIGLIKQKYKFIEFTSIITGTAASAGTIMAIVADKRYMTKYAHAMIHELSASRNGKFSHIKSYTNFLTELHDTLVSIYLSKVKIDREFLENMLVDETWFSAVKYKELGFVDDIK